MNETLKDKLCTLNSKGIAAHLKKLTHDELAAAYTEADMNGELWSFGTQIALEAARRYFAGEK